MAINKNFKFLLCLLILQFLIIDVYGVTQCLSDTGSAVDWWIAIKYPNSRAYSYTDSSKQGNSLTQSKYSFTQNSPSCLNYTLSQIYDVSKISYTIYNDQPPENDESYFQQQQQQQQLHSKIIRAPMVDDAHAKGIVATDDSANGFWLVHSVPEFPVSPNSSNSFEYMQDGQTQYAQNLFCVSINSWSNFNLIGKQLQYYRPNYYASYFTSTAKSSASSWYDSSNDIYIHSAQNSLQSILSRSKMTINSFAKTGYYGSGWDMYSEFVAPSLKLDLYAETWRRGSGTPLPSSCDKTYKVENIKDLNINGHAWDYLDDHSKWAISSSSSSTWVCMCDINRMASQGNRGGGCLCFQNSGLHSSLLSSVAAAEKCP
eukprot:TRINITY_DN1264_c0_g1_i1.p1 TRINITY_DN1264_c0_g1~~TRINITY_DN1264_c0_g1_i1.p1  ORF type:complete len:387 (+),score=191.59 TRINITY_DN1264_c0_g1_i1:48-1163(+)